MQAVPYARVSITDQTAAHQRTQAEAAGFKIDHVVTDEGVSGVSTVLADRPQGRRLFDMLRRGDVLAVRWVDRLGRNYADVTETIREFMGRGVIVKTVINVMVFDGATTDPMQQVVRDALIGFMAAMSQAQAEATKEAQTAGIAHAQARDNAYLGRKPSYTRAQFDEVVNGLSNGRPSRPLLRPLGSRARPSTASRIFGSRPKPLWPVGLPDPCTDDEKGRAMSTMSTPRVIVLVSEKNGLAVLDEGCALRIPPATRSHPPVVTSLSH